MSFEDDVYGWAARHENVLWSKLPTGILASMASESTLLAVLRIEGELPVPVGYALAVLDTLKSLYLSGRLLEIASVGRHPSILEFGGSQRSMEEAVQSLGSGFYPELILTSVNFASPGFIEVIGALFPLAVVAKMWNDAHERRKDKQYREQAEARRLLLENASLEIKVIGDAIDTLRKSGSSELLLERFLVTLTKPLETINRAVDDGISTNAALTVSSDEVVQRRLQRIVIEIRDRF